MLCFNQQICRILDWDQFSKALKSSVSADTFLWFEFQITCLETTHKCYIFWMSMFYTPGPENVSSPLSISTANWDS